MSNYQAGWNSSETPSPLASGGLNDEIDRFQLSNAGGDCRDEEMDVHRPHFDPGRTIVLTFHRLNLVPEHEIIHFFSKYVYQPHLPLSMETIIITRRILGSERILIICMYACQ